MGLLLRFQSLSPQPPPPLRRAPRLTRLDDPPAPAPPEAAFPLTKPWFRPPPSVCRVYPRGPPPRPRPTHLKGSPVPHRQSASRPCLQSASPPPTPHSSEFSRGEQTAPCILYSLNNAPLCNETRLGSSQVPLAERGHDGLGDLETVRTRA